ncbi:hypothetical protein CCR95_16190 [Thiocystis minor]|uniref:hypothetical protein n=1 Tax=Thiocystis minor TaxID=61597 RepID=UPI001912670F|nr:hypothetical protein [Thiocystis minor]MBK5965584.1 hypothetical protein [Thiocystis minor]
MADTRNPDSTSQTPARDTDNRRGLADAYLSAIEGAVQIDMALHDPTKMTDLIAPLTEALVSVEALHQAFLVATRSRALNALKNGLTSSQRARCGKENMRTLTNMLAPARPRRCQGG